MSSPASPARSRLPRLTPGRAQVAVQRARLSLVPRPARERANRIPFVTLISLVLLAGVVGLLMFNTSMQQASFRETALEGQASDLSAREEALQMEIQNLSDPQRVAAQAQKMGLVIPDGPAGVLNLRNGKVEGKPTPATGSRLPLAPPPPRKPKVLNPKPVVAAPAVGSRDDRGNPDNRDSAGDRDPRRGAGDGAATGNRGAREGRNEPGRR